MTENDNLKKIDFEGEFDDIAGDQGEELGNNPWNDVNQRQASRTRLDVFQIRDESHPVNGNYEPKHQIFLGPLSHEDRSCTDIGWLLGLLIIFTLIGSYMAYQYYMYDFNRYTSENDFRADLCGKFQLADKPYLYFIDPRPGSEQGFGDIGMCVNSCPRTADLDYCFYDVNGKDILEDYCFQSYPTQEYQDRWCMPYENNETRKNIETIIKTYYMLWKQLAWDFFQAREIIAEVLVGMGMLGAFYMFMSYFQVTGYFWFIIALLATPGVGVLTYLFLSDLEYKKMRNQNCYQNQPDQDCLQQRYLVFIGSKYFFIGAPVLFLIAILVNFQQFKLIREAIDQLKGPLRKVKTKYIFPFVFSFLQILAIGVFLITVIYIMTSGQAETYPTPALKYGTLHDKKAFQMYYYKKQLIQYVIFLQKRPFSRPLYYGFRYHLGSFIKGGFQSVMTWVYRSIFRSWNALMWHCQMKSEKGKENKPLTFLLFICSPYMQFFQFWTKYISNLTMQHMALYADNFNDSCEKVYYLILRNGSRHDFFLPLFGYIRICGAFFAASGGTLIIYGMILVNQRTPLLNQSLEKIQYPFALAFSLFILGVYIPQSMVFSLMADEQMFMGQERFCEPSVLAYFNQYTKEKTRKDLEFKGNKDNMFNNGDDDKIIQRPKTPQAPPPPPPPQSSQEEEDQDLGGADNFADQNKQPQITKIAQQEEKQKEPEPIKQPQPQKPQFEVKGIQVDDIGEQKEQEEYQYQEEDNREEQIRQAKKNKAFKQYQVKKQDDIILDKNAAGAQSSSSSDEPSQDEEPEALQDDQNKGQPGKGNQSDDSD